MLDSRERLLDRLSKYQEARPHPNCKRIFDLSDVEDIDGKNWRIKCRNCSEIFVEKVLYGRDNKIRDFIDVLERDLEKDIQADLKLIVTDAKLS